MRTQEEAFRETAASFSDDEEDSLQRTSAQSDEEDAFSPRIGSRAFPPPPIDTKLDDEFFRRSGEDDTPRGVCSPLVQSFSMLTTRGPFSPTHAGADGGFAPGEPGTPRRRLSIQLTPSQDSMKNRPPQVRTLYSRESRANKNPTGVSNNRLSALAALSPNPPERPQRTPVESNPFQPNHNPNPTLADFHPTLSSAATNKPPPPPPPAVADKPPRHNHHLSPPPKPRPGHGRRVSLERSDLMPSPVANQSWNTTPKFYSEATLAAVSAVSTLDAPPPAQPMRMLSPLPLHAGMRAMMTSPAPPAEPRANAATTPNDNLKAMLAPRRPSKRISNPCRVICPSSPMTPSSSGTVGLDAIPSLPDVPHEPTEEASPCLILNKTDSLRMGKLVRRMSEQNRQEMDSPAVLRRAISVPLTRPERPLKQTVEQQRIEYERCRLLVAALVRRGAQLVCLDWDMTVIGLHTKSEWFGTADQLAAWIRPEFKNFITAAYAHKLRVAFVSFSGQTQLVYGAIRSIFPGEDVFRSGLFVVRCSDKQWEAEKGPFEKMFPHASRFSDRSKLAHICSAKEYFWPSTDKENSDPQTQIRPENIFLIDDDKANIKDAEQHGVNSFHMDIENPSRFFNLLEEWCHD